MKTRREEITPMRCGRLGKGEGREASARCDKITEPPTFSNHLYTRGCRTRTTDRTAGEMRVSNTFCGRISYAELLRPARGSGGFGVRGSARCHAIICSAQTKIAGSINEILVLTKMRNSAFRLRVRNSNRAVRARSSHDFSID